MSQIIFRERATPSTPASGQMSLFSDTSGDLAWIDDGGFLTKIVTTGAATITLPNATDTVAVLGTAQIFTGQNTFNEHIVMASGKGISFAATTQASGMTSETLTDYEEGTWTPGFSCVTVGNLSVTLGGQNTGHYTKIGNLVYVSFLAQASSFTHSTASGAFLITGLPFTTAQTIDAGALNTLNSFNKSGFTQFNVRSNSAAQSELRFTAIANNTASADVQITDVPSGSAKNIYGSLVYQT